MTKSFTGLMQILVIRWVPGCFVAVGAGMARAITQITSTIMKRRGCTIVELEGYQQASLGHPERLECS